MQFRWTPSEPLSADAIARMKAHFHKPESDPPEPWFMSAKQRYFSGLQEALTNHPADTYYVQDFLHDVGGGIRIFGRRQEWVDWYLFLLPFLLERIFEDELLLLTLNYFFNLYPHVIVEEYSGFRDDVLVTLGRCIMNPFLWENGDLDTQHWWFDEWAGYWVPSLNASMMFGMKYLTDEEIPEWIASIGSIQGDHWLASIRSWTRGLKQMESFMLHPDTLPDARDEWEARLEGIERYLNAANIDWNGVYLIFQREDAIETFDIFISQAKRNTFWREVAKYPRLTPN